jgi:hypothetical protein
MEGQTNPQEVNQMDIHERLKGLNKTEQAEVCNQAIDALLTNLNHLNSLYRTLTDENAYKEEECRAIEFEMKADKVQIISF